MAAATRSSCLGSVRQEDWELRELAKEEDAVQLPRCRSRCVEGAVYGFDGSEEKEEEEEEDRLGRLCHVSDRVDERVVGWREVSVDDLVEEGSQAPHPRRHLLPQRPASLARSRLLRVPDRGLRL